MSSALEGWYVDPSTGTNLRFWNGTTWTDEVAPMPYEPVHSGEVDLFAAAAAATVPASDAEAETELVPETDAHAPAESAAETTEPALPDLDPEIERTRLTRRELRARRGTDEELNDAPRHLPPIVPPTAVSLADWSEPEELEIPPVPVIIPTEPDADPEPDEDPSLRRHRIIRMSVLLGILAVVSSVGVLTAGTL